MNIFYKLFIEHPVSVDENYFTHAYKATLFGLTLILFGILELIHAILPGIDIFHLFKTTSDKELDKLSAKLKSRRT